MDIKREGIIRKKRIRMAIYLVITAGALETGSYYLSKLKPAAPTVERAAVWVEAVKRGPMVRDVKGLGTLVPEDILWIQAAFDSQVSRIMVQSGDEVKPDTVL